jgi:hypothetical protein
MASVKTTSKHPGGRPRLNPDVEWKQIHALVEPDLHAVYKAIGSTDWLREALRREAKKLAKKTPPAG